MKTSTRYIYFVSYLHARGMGNIEISLDSLIADVQQIREIEKAIKKEEPRLDQVAVMYFTLLNTTEVAVENV